MREAVDIISPDKLKDVLITRTAIKTLKSEDWVEKVVTFQFKGARDAFKIFSEVEVSGFGKYTVSQRKVRGRISRYSKIEESMEKALQKDLHPGRRATIEARLGKLREDLAYMKTKEKRED